MLDHKACDAFMAVIDTGSFDAAAVKLHITASAVSLRVQRLERELGQLLVLRERPCRCTDAGQLLMTHLRQLRLSQQSFIQQLHGAADAHRFQRVSIASNADSLATWLLACIAPSLIEHKIILDVHLADQSKTYHLLETGQVNACISTQSQALRACKAQLIGHMPYRLAATPSFQQQYFPQGLNRQDLLVAPAVIFNADDQLHQDCMLQHFGISSAHYPHHFIPSSNAFMHCIELGLGYGLLPDIQMQQALHQGRLILLDQTIRVDVALYWHHWPKQSTAMHALTEQIRCNAQLDLEPKTTS